MTVHIALGGIELDLLPGRVAYRPDTATLFVADMHLGKSGTFRAHGVPVPESSTPDLQRLASLTKKYDAHTVVVLGDLLRFEASSAHRFKKNSATFLCQSIWFPETMICTPRTSTAWN